MTPTDSGGRDITQVAQHNQQNVQSTGASKSGTEAGPSVNQTENRDRQSAVGGKIPRGFGKIVRDEEGNVIDVELGEEERSEDGEGALMEEGDEIGQPESSEWLLGGRGEEGHATEVIQGVCLVCLPHTGIFSIADG